jgi:hypothetical protein
MMLMAKTQKVLNDEIKQHYLEKVKNLLEELGEDVIQVKSNELAFPVVDSEGGEKSVVIVVKVPTGSNKGTEPYDPYAMGEEFQLKEQAKKEKAEKSAKLKAEKIEKDRLRREKEKLLKEKRESGKG